MALQPLMARDAIRILEMHIAPHLRKIRGPVEPETITGMTKASSEMLPKSVRNASVMLHSKRSKAFAVAQEIGLIDMLGSRSLHSAAEAVSGFRLSENPGFQVICYQPGDYVGPHNDHHPEDEEARQGYIDLHLSFSTAAVAHQWLVYEHDNHLSQVQSIKTMGGLSCYRLPLWHYTTPLAARPGRIPEARRWVLLGTFLDAPPVKRGASQSAADSSE